MNNFEPKFRDLLKLKISSFGHNLLEMTSIKKSSHLSCGNGKRNSIAEVSKVAYTTEWPGDTSYQLADF